LKLIEKFSNKTKSNNNNNNNMVRRQMYTDEELEQKVDLFLDEFSQNKNTGVNTNFLNIFKYELYTYVYF